MNFNYLLTCIAVGLIGVTVISLGIADSQIPPTDAFSKININGTYINAEKYNSEFKININGLLNYTIIDDGVEISYTIIDQTCPINQTVYGIESNGQLKCN